MIVSHNNTTPNLTLAVHANLKRNRTIRTQTHNCCIYMKSYLNLCIHHTCVHTTKGSVRPILSLIHLAIVYILLCMYLCKLCNNNIIIHALPFTFNPSDMCQFIFIAYSYCTSLNDSCQYFSEMLKAALRSLMQGQTRPLPLSPWLTLSHQTKLVTQL